MPTVIMPKMGDAMEEGTLLRWLKNEGDQVAQGEPIAEIETDKVNLEIEANDAGVMSRHLVEEGATVPIGEPIAFIAAPGEEAEAPAAIEPASAEPQAQPAATGSGQAPVTSQQQGPQAGVAASDNHFAAPNGQGQGQGQAPATTQAQPEPMPAQVGDRSPNERVRASPLVRRLAAEHGIDLSQVQGTGPGGRIVKVDVMPFVGRTPAQQPAAAPAPVQPQVQPQAQPAAQPAAQPQAPAAQPAPQPVAAPESELRELPRIRRTIGRRMSESWQQAPHIFLTALIDMDGAMALREQVNAQVQEPESQLSVNDIILKATALALRKFETLNASVEGEQMRINKRIDVGFAVAFENGLISPVLHDTDRLSLGEIARKTKELARKVREGTIRPEEFQGGTFTVSNLGMFGIDSFTSIINPPQVGILAVGTVRTEPVYRDGQFKPVQQMKVTLSVDHRIVDGAVGARFLQELRRLLEAPMTLLVG
jgi:pyruvate dehydrogenase E2 component (dihydrolipoamide acetyltransferase)